MNRKIIVLLPAFTISGRIFTPGGFAQSSNYTGDGGKGKSITRDALGYIAGAIAAFTHSNNIKTMLCFVLPAEGDPALSSPNINSNKIHTDSCIQYSENPCFGIVSSGSLFGE